MKVTKLPWAGIKVETDDTTLVIDPLYHFPTKFGQPHEPFFPLNEFGDVDAVLVTHHHPDHFDPEAIAQAYGTEIPVYMSSESMRFIGPTSLKQLHGVTLGQRLLVGSAEITPAFSMDGFGDPQVSWIVKGSGRQLIHCGDTLWHGHWWNIRKDYGPFDIACMPVNAAIVNFRGDPPSGQPISLSPEQAVSAAHVLGAKTLIPIHYKAIDCPPIYTQTPDLLHRLHASAQERGVTLAVLDSKGSIVS
ncbi:MBL fold metallo-hydrolase [Paenibacillus hexagrammi]|uniref:MBL fold metallo-hydrolase n=1 Tax=Paenibacillus hexagrammi TaxID=2908839 RepID=A0ABY3SJJ0_9BACL|nr:MBL fold metallo-hydrolase [Paenibacillus sp. YPD9-1]UJF33978.1 MBL fold metallo-hydrolase [Paenibacillus sp. YPD9-1]